MDVAFDPNEEPEEAEVAAMPAAPPKRKIPDEVQQLFKCRATVYAMLRKRGYVAPPAPDVVSAQKFVEKFGVHVERSRLLLSVRHAADPTNALHVAFVGASGQSQVGVGPIRSVVQQLLALSDRKARIIIIGTCKLSPQAKVVVQQEAHHGNVIEYFMEAELLFDITEHSLVPRHEILTDDEKKALLDKYRLNGLMLPQIKISDPVARFLGMQAGQIARITRKTRGNATCVTYRIVVAPKIL